MEEGRRIPLRDKTGTVIDWAICSEQHYEALSKFTWCKTNGGYAMSNKAGKTGYSSTMHIYIMTALEGHVILDGYIVDHKPPGNKLDNRVHMLRIVTHAVNAKNKQKRKGTSSDFIGVAKRPNGKYKASIIMDNKHIDLGYYLTAAQGARARDKYILEHPTLFDEGYYLTFPNDIATTLSMPPYIKKQKTTPYMGVSQDGNMFVGFVVTGRKFIFRYRSSDAEECARARDDFIVSMKLDRKLNFDDRHPEYSTHRKVKIEYVDMDNDTIQLLCPQYPNMCIRIDKEDYESIKHYHLGVSKSVYPVLVEGRKSTRLNRFIMRETHSNILIDHIDNDPTNNKKNNLRRGTVQQNAQNRRKQKNKSSIYQGVYQNGSNSYTASIRNYNKFKSKTFKLEEHAGRFRDLYIILNMPDSFYKMNFDDWTEEKIAEWRIVLKL